MRAHNPAGQVVPRGLPPSDSSASHRGQHEAALSEHQLTIPNQTSDWSDSRICWLAALAVTIFVITGSLVPFDLTWPGGLTLASWPMQLRFTPWQLVSGTDVIVNVAVGAPLGFFLAGAVRSDGRCSGTVAMLAATGMAAVLATTVELFQVLSAFRQSSWNDVLAQTAGAAAGAIGWMSIRPASGPVAAPPCRRAGTLRLRGSNSQLYLPIYLLVQFTTVDAIRASELPTDHSRAQVILLPIGSGSSPRCSWDGRAWAARCSASQSACSQSSAG